MFGSCKKGFTLIEILVAIIIIGIMAAIVIPNLAPRRASAERNAFIAKLNGLMSFAWQNALTTGLIHKVVFDITHKTVSLQQATEKKSSEGDVKFDSFGGTYFATSIAWPHNLQIKNFYLEGFDEMKRSSGGAKEIWFFVMPDGLTQRVTLNIIDSNDVKQNGRPERISLVLNPFNAQFVVYDTFKK